MQKTLDTQRLASQQATLEGEMALADMERLNEAVAGATAPGNVQYCLDFSKDENGRIVINGRIQTKVVLECQRCGQAVNVLVDSEPHLMVVYSDEQAKHVPREYEPLLVESGPVTLLAVLEEELLLALPMVPRHVEGECPVDLPDYLN